MPAPDYAAEIQALRAGLANSELTIEENGSRVTYANFDEIRKRIEYFLELVANPTSSTASAFGFSAVAYSGD